MWRGRGREQEGEGEGEEEGGGEETAVVTRCGPTSRQADTFLNCF